MSYWSDINGYEDYKISQYGEVVSFRGNGRGITKNPRILTQRSTNGYKRVALTKNKKTKYFFVHRLVLEAFAGSCPEGMQCCHNNGVRHDNRLENLRWDTPKNNHADRMEHGTYGIGENNSRAILKNDEVFEIKRIFKTGKVTIKYLSRMFKIKPNRTRSIVNNRSWAHI